MPKILGPDGQPIDLGMLREPQTARTIHLQREFDAHPARGITPARLARVLLDGEQGDLTPQLELADDIEERDGHAFAELGKRKGAISALDWDVQPPASPSADEKMLADAVREWLQSEPAFADLLQGVMDGVHKGYAMHELVWQPDGKQLRPKFSFAPQRWFTTSPDRRGLLLRSTAVQGGTDGLPPKAAEPLLPFAWLVHVHPARSGYLTRNGLVRVLAWPFLFKHYAQRDMAEFLEVFGLPTRIGRYPAGASLDEKRTLAHAVAGIGHNAAGVIPQGMAIELLAAAQGTEGPFTAMWDRMDGITSKVILGQTLTAGEGTHGTQALGNVHNEVRHDIRNADARQVEQTINGFIGMWCTLNWPGADPKRLPRWSLDTGEAEDLAAYADSLPKLAGAGLRIDVAWAHDRLRIPQAKEGAVLVQGPARAAATGSDGNGDGQDDGPNHKPDDKPDAKQAAKALAAELLAALAATKPTRAAATQRDAIDDLVDAAAAQWRPQLGPLAAPLLAEAGNAIAAGESLAQFAARLPSLVAQLDAGPLADQLARAAFAARLAGEADLDLA